MPCFIKDKARLRYIILHLKIYVQNSPESSSMLCLEHSGVPVSVDPAAVTGQVELAFPSFVTSC